MRVGVGQFASTTDKRANLVEALDLVNTAAGQGAELVVLPEAAMFPFGGPAAEVEAAAEPLDGTYVSALAAAAAQHDVTIVAGMFEAVAGDDHVYNTVVAVGPGGLLGRYRKLHLFDALGWRESDVLRAGALDADALLVLPVGELTIGVVTCYDLRFPEIFRALVDRGVNVLVVPAAWVAGPLKEEHWATLVAARAIENTCYLVAAAQAPPQFCGRSAILDPMGVLLAGLGEIAGVAVADLFLERVHEVRSKLPVLEHRRFGVRSGD